MDPARVSLVGLSELTRRFTFLNNVKWPLFAKYDSPQLYGIAREIVFHNVI